MKDDSSDDAGLPGPDYGSWILLLLAISAFFFLGDPGFLPAALSGLPGRTLFLEALLFLGLGSIIALLAWKRR